MKEIWPLCETDGLVGAIQHPDDGYIQPADLTQALAKGARARGAEIYRNTTVTGIERTPAGEWLVRTDRGDIACEHVVSRHRQLRPPHRRDGRARHPGDPGRAPVHRHRAASGGRWSASGTGLPEMGVLREADSSWYLREENGGFILGPYEPGAPCCYLDGPADGSEYELFQEDLERLGPHIETAIARVPAFGEVGVKKVYNGAIAYTPDGSPIVGPAWDLPNFWLNEGHSFGVTAAGGAGWQLAEWIVEGEPSIDMMGVDPRRFGPYATRGYLRQKNEEAYANVFTVHYPDEERAAARPLKRAPCYDRMKALGAVFGSRLRLGAAELVRAGGLRPVRGGPRQARRAPQREPPARANGERPREKLELPPLQLLRLRRPRGAPRPRGGRPPGHDRLRQVRGLRARRRGLPRRARRQPAAAEDRAARPRAHAVAERRRALRVHGLPRGGRSASTSSAWARPSATTSTTCPSCARATARSTSRR